LYLEADLRRPSLGAQLGATTKSGLSVVLAGMIDIQAALQSVEGIDLLLAGPLPPNPAELIESESMSELVRWGEEHYDRVIIDTPPAAVVSDAIPLVTEVSGVVIVVRIQRSRRDAADHLREQLTNVGAPVLGLVVNGASTRGNYYYGPTGVNRVRDAAPDKNGKAGAGGNSRPTAKQGQGQGQQQRRKQQQQGRSSSQRAGGQRSKRSS
jgi:capsular exopolysaccharide synthesis family protein